MAKALKKPKKETTSWYKMPDPLPEVEILTDTSKKQWRLKPFIGLGEFGKIYAAQEASSKSSKYPFVIKIEPHENEPLFVEMRFYMKNAKKTDIDKFKKEHKLKTFGMPAYIGSGSHWIGCTKYRFIVIEKFGNDVDKLRHQNGGVLPTSTVFQLAWQMTYILEYIHSFDYVHADVKGTNILMGTTPGTKNQAYLVDFGLVTKVTKDKEFKPNPKKAHNGTIEYLSRDAHQGVPTRRGDLEMLAYNMIHWLCGKLPWESKLSDPKLVQQIKEDYMNGIPKFLKTCFASSPVPNGLVQFLKYVAILQFNDEPNYDKIQDMFEKEVKKNGCTISSPLEFTSSQKRRSLTNGETPEKKSREEEAVNNGAKPKVVQKKKGKKEASNEVKEYRLYDKVTSKKKKEVAASDEEVLTDRLQDKVTLRKKKEVAASDEEVLTDAMKEILAKKDKKAPKTKATATVVHREDESEQEENFEGYTAEMIQIKMKNQKTTKSKKKTDSIPNQNGDVNHPARNRRNMPLVNYNESRS